MTVDDEASRVVARQLIAEVQNFIDGSVQLCHKFGSRDEDPVAMEGRIASMAAGLLVTKAPAEIAVIAAVCIERVAMMEALDDQVPGKR